MVRDYIDKLEELFLEIKGGGTMSANNIVCTSPQANSISEKECDLIVPDTDLVEEHSERFRALLLDWLVVGKGRYALDLRNVRRIDPIGMQILQCFIKMLRHKQKGASLVIVNADESIADEMRMMRIEKYSGVVLEDEEEENKKKTKMFPNVVLAGEVERKFSRMVRHAEIRPFFQPIVDLHANSVLGYEILSRGTPPFEAPGEMFAMAEKLDMLWELERACRTRAFQGISEHSEQLSGKLYFINVSPHIFSDQRFVEGFTLRALSRYGINHNQVVIEITEEAAFFEYEKLERLVNHYVRQGFYIALDDFGAGHSSMIKLVSVSPEFIKLDRAIVKDVDKSSYKQMLVKSIVSFASGVESKLIAEGIETEEELKTLVRFGVRYGQGFFLGLPAPEPEPLGLHVCKTIDEAVRTYNYPQVALDDTISGLVHRPRTIPAFGYTCEDCNDLFQRNPKLDHMVVLDDREMAVGIITRQHFYQETGGPFGYPLFQKKSVEAIARKDCLRVGDKMSVVTLAKHAMERDRDSLYDPVLVSGDSDEFLGTVTIKQLLRRAGDLEVDNAIGANPLTRLPGNRVLQKWIADIAGNDDFGMIYADLNYFKEYNDAYGFLKGDDAIKMTADVLVRHAPEIGKDAKVAHIGGDDLVVVSPTRITEEVLEDMCETFDSLRMAYFNSEDAANGYYVSTNRRGEEVKVPLLSVALSAINSDSISTEPHPAMLSQIAASLKKKIKSATASTGKSGYMIERRRVGAVSDRSEPDWH